MFTPSPFGKRGGGNQPRPQNVFTHPYISPQDSQSPRPGPAQLNSTPLHPLLPGLFTATSNQDARTSIPNRASMQSLRNEPAHYNSGLQAQRSQVFGLSSLSINETPRQGPPPSRSSLHKSTPSYRSSSDDLASVISEQDSNKAELSRLKSQESMRFGQEDRIRQLEQRIKEQDAVITEQKELVEKQKVTIKNQSQALSDPRTYQPATGPRGYMTHATSFSTPRHGRHTPFPQHLGPPPAFNMMPYSHQMPLGPRSEGYRPHDVPQTPVPSRTNRREIPDPFKMAAVTPSTTKSSQAPCLINAPSPTTRIPVLTGSISDVLEYVGRFDNLFAKSERFACNYANIPNMYRDGQISTMAKANLIALSAPGQATQLMNSQSTRYFVVAAVINRYMLDNLLKLDIFKVLNESLIKEMHDLRLAVNDETPVKIRTEWFELAASSFRDIIETKEATAYIEKMVKLHVPELLKTILPLMVGPSTMAHHDLDDLLRDAMNTAVSMYKGPFDWEIKFAAYNTPFQPSIMQSKDLVANSTPGNLIARGMIVRLVISPEIKLTNNADQKVVEHAVHKSMVLLKPANGGYLRGYTDRWIAWWLNGWI